jgi:hypothetical protein
MNVIRTGLIGLGDRPHFRLQLEQQQQPPARG